MPPHLYRAPAASEELRNFVDIPLAALVKGTARAAAVNFAFRFVRYPLSLFSVAALARLLTPSDFGVYEVVGAFASLWAAFGDLGITGAVIHKEVLEEDDLSGLFWVNIAAGLILLTILSASGPVIAKVYKDPRQAGLAVLAGLAFLMISVQAPFAAICTRRLEFWKLNVASITGQLLGVSLGALCALYGLGPWALAVQALAATSTPALMFWLMVPWRPSFSLKWSRVRPLVSFGLQLTLSRWSFNIFMRLDKIILGLFVSVAVLGEYGRAFFLATLPFVVLCDPVTQPLVSMLARMNGENPERVKGLYIRFWQFNITVPMLMALLLVPFGGDLVRVVYGQQWVEAGRYLALLSVAAFSYVPVSSVISLGTVHGEVASLCRFSLAVAPIFIVCLLLGAKFGAVGVSIGLSSSMTIAALVGIWLSNKWFGLKSSAFFASCLPPFVVALSVVGVGVVSRTFFAVVASGKVLPCVLSVAVVLSVYTILMVRFCPAIISDALQVSRKLLGGV
ncbi:MAG TPA: lipopolysaccharide biosynthesis protein [Candidatus Limnocylindria bacterium]|nr:lipopolysaccharide biosynthesis protein [Candidatus Limnocylindria bacterium]